MANRQVIAVDLGAESGRVMRIGFDGAAFHIQESHRFPNVPVWANNTLHWDVLRLWHDISDGIKPLLSGSSSIGVDTWGVDFALLDRNGHLLSNPVHYRDRRNEGMMDWVFQHVPSRELFQRTGIQFLPFNGLFQIASLIRDNSPLLDAADTFLTIADLFNYWFSGSKTCEFTHVTTQQLYSPHTQSWDWQTIETLGLPKSIFGEIVMPGTRIGEYHGVPVIAPACHDTGSAIIAVPTVTENYAYISSGTWSLLGLEIKEAIINDEVYAANLTNEGGAYNTFRMLKNIMGLWLAQQCRATWMEQGKDFGYDQLAAMAESAEPFRSLVEPDDPVFLPPGDMPSRIQEFCRQTSQPIPETEAQIMRTVYESLAMKYRYVLEQCIAISGRQVDRLHIIGGGAKNALLSQMTANAIGRIVVAGPTEATAMGNAIVQFIALGEIKNLAEARELLSRTMDTTTYEPRDTATWDEHYEKFKAFFKAG